MAVPDTSLEFVDGVGVSAKSDHGQTFQFNQNRHIDMFKDGISVPGLTLRYMFQDLPDYFTLPDEKNKDLYELYKNNIVGGPSIVFHRYHEKDKTFIRPAEYTDPKPCQLIYGVDANALYLWSIMQKMPNSHFVRRKKEDGFKRQAPRRYECTAYAGKSRLSSFR
jgi:hypothetical protein